jgi:hypothetical protein
MTAPLGDPAACSLAGGSLARLGAHLDSAASRADAAWREVREGWVGAAARRAAAQYDTLARGTHATGAELGRLGRRLQEHTADLAEAVQAVRDVEARAATAGLQVRDGRVTPAWGVAGVADEQSAAARERAREALQHELDGVLLHLSRRRARLADALDAGRIALAHAAAELRA